MNILLSGATSFLGRAVTEELIGQGHEVYALLRPDSAHLSVLPAYEGFHRVFCSMQDAAALPEKKLPGMDLCMHLAWEGVGVKGRMDADLQEENVKNTLKLMQASSELSCSRFLFAGSQAEYGVTEERVKEGMFSGEPVSEKTVCHPVSQYGKAKLRVLQEGSTLADFLDLAYIHMRIFSVYGAGDHESSLVSSCVRAARAGQNISLGPCSQLWNYLYVKDAARAILALAESTWVFDGDSSEPEDHVVNVGSPDTRPLKDFVREIFETAGGAGRYAFAERPAGPEGTPWLSPSLLRFRKLTGSGAENEFSFTSFHEGITHML